VFEMLIAALLIVGVPPKVGAQDQQHSSRVSRRQPIPLPEFGVPGLLEQDYVVKQAMSGTKTDTPLIEVVPRRLLDDKALTLIDAVRNVSGVRVPFSAGGSASSSSSVASSRREGLR
jgi:outer membrane receptor for monomeric catechols